MKALGVLVIVGLVHGACGAERSGSGRMIAIAGATTPNADTSGGEHRDTPITMSFERPDGTRRNLAEVRGRAVLIIAATMDDLRTQVYVRNAERVAQRHGDDLAVFVLLGDEHPRRQLGVMADAYGSVLELRRSQIVLADEAIRSGDSPLGRIEHVPTTFLVNRAGLVARRLEGVLTDSQIEDLVRPALPPRTATATSPAGPP